MNTTKKKTVSTVMYIGLLVLFFLFFYRISSWMPVVGDDWGYAIGGIYHNPLSMAARNYITWSGRFLSELWGFTVASHKGIWNVLNASFFTGILYLLTRNSNNVAKIWTTVLAILLMVTVNNAVRMQTYTWIMGTTYVIPLLLFLVHLVFLKDFVFDGKEGKGRIAAMAVLNVAITLYMENAAALVVGSDLLVLIYLWFKDKAKLKKMAVITVCGAIGLCIIRFSPGAMARMARDHAEFNSFSLLGKIAFNWPYFINLSFMAEPWLMRVLSAVLIAETVMRRKDGSKNLWILLVLVFAMGLVQSFSWELCSLTNLGFFYTLADITVTHSTTINTIIYMGQALAILVLALFYEKDEKRRWYMIFVYLCAMGADAVMLISPIFDARSSLYTIYMLILFVLVTVSQWKLDDRNAAVLTLAALVFAMPHVKSYYETYRLVSQVTEKRAAQIAYYKDHPEEEEAWLIAYPDQTIHSGNIDPTDSYHIMTFIAYYGLREDLKLNFYWLDDYSPASIAKG